MGEHSRYEKRIKVKITNTGISNSFIKIKVQNVNSNEFIALMDLKSIYKSADDITNEDIQLGDNLYIVRLDLDNYARCRIVEMNDYNSAATIELIDSCCKIKINYNQLRILPKSSSLYKIPSISNEYVIAELIVSKEYDDYRQKFVKFHELVVNKFLGMEILSENRAGKYVHLYSLEASIVHDIVPNHPTLKSILKRIHLSEQMSLMLEQYNNESCHTSPEKLHPSSTPSDLLSFSSVDQFPIDEKYEVRISAYVKGPKLFYVQSTKVLQKYQQFHIDLQKLDLHPLKRHPKVSEICLAFLDSNNVQRVEIMETNDDMFKVRMIDHGTEHVVNFKDLYVMPESIISEKPFAWKFALHDIDKLNNLNNMEMSFYFQYITNNKRLILVTKSGSADMTAKCSLFDGTNNIFDMLSAWDPRTLRYPNQITLINSHKVKIVFAESPKLFFVNICEATNLHSALFEEFSNFNGCNYRIPTVNSACYVTVNNKNWRGSFEKRISSSICQIKLVDIGITEDFSCKEVKVMVEKFTNVPPLAYKCCLVEYKTKSFDNDILKAFIMKCKQFQTFNMNIIDYDGDIYYVALENDLEQSISNELLENASQISSKTPPKEVITKQIQLSPVQNEDQPQTSSFLDQSSPIIRRSAPSKIIEDWTNDERREFGEKNSWDDSSNDDSFQEFNCNGMITSIISPNDFTIQCSKTLPLVKKIVSELQISAPNDCPLTEFVNGTLCIAMNPYSNEWCRSIILDAHISEDNTLVTVRDVDNGQIFSVENLNELKRGFIFMMKPYFGIRCGLPIKIKHNIDDEAMRLFVEMCSNKEIRYKIIAMNEFINVCDILVDDKSVTDRLVELDVAVKLKYIPNDSVFVPFVKNLTEFYVHLERELQLIENINHYAKHYEQIPLKAPVEGMTVMASSKKYNKWYRGKILSIDEAGIKVKYMEFGDTEILKKSDLGMMDEYCFLKQLPLAHRCSFDLPKDLNPDSPKAIEEFKKIINNGFKKLNLRMIEPKLNRSIVALYLEDETNILEKLLIQLCDKLDIKETSMLFDSKISNSTASSESFL
ncbi:tudor domain-containing protein 6-like [Chironomus tepperi]|uniref:tudor domain-containing protein 6-like n=1 Tax=Chironomus tepperi TaxID=113505 RepID=UPI00391F827B